MKNISWFLGAFLLVSFVGLADAQLNERNTGFPTSKPRTQAEAQNPLPPQITVSPPQVNVPAPVVNVAPAQVSFSTPAASTLDEVKSWLLVTFSGLITALLAKIGFRPAVSRVVPVAETSSELPAEASVLLRLRDRVADPDFKAKVDAALLAAVGTGVPGRLVQGGLGAIPVAGPLVGGFAQPLIEEAFVAFLKNRLASNTKG